LRASWTISMHQRISCSSSAAMNAGGRMRNARRSPLVSEIGADDGGGEVVAAAALRTMAPALAVVSAVMRYGLISRLARPFSHIDCAIEISPAGMSNWRSMAV
jgi:hypothetical protein